MSGFHEIPARPYKGLARFDDSELDERFFFGRERETELVASNLVASRLTVLYGPSGVGKSSLLRAGVVRRLRTLVPAGGESGAGDGALPVVVDAWRDDPLAAIAAAAGARTPATPEELADVLAERAAEVGGEIYLVLDQMEEYFVYHGRDRGGPLRDALAEILARPELRVHVLLGIRDDALAELDALKGRVPGLFGNVLRLDHLDIDAARAAIVEPLAELEALGGPRVEAEPALVAAVVDQVASGRIERRLSGRGIVAGAGRRGRVEAPYLQLVMDRIWEVERERGSSVLHAQTLAELGGSGRIVQQHLERALASLDAPERELVARLFNQLVTPSGTKIAHAVGDLSRYAGESPERLEDVLHALSAERVVRALPGRNGGGARYEIFHDVLAGAVLEWGARHEADRALAEEREAARRRHRRLAVIAGLALVALALMGLLTVYAFSQRSEAREQAALAGEARLKAERSAAAATEARKDAEASARGEIRQRQKAERATKRALASEKRADERAAEARAQARIADRERDNANFQRQLANDARASAQQNAVAEERAKEVAVAAKNDAIESKKDAVAAKKDAVADRDRAKKALVGEQRALADAKEARERADARALVSNALSLLTVDPERTLQLALKSARVERTVELERALREGLIAVRAKRILPGAGGPVNAVAVSADGRLLAVASESGGVRVFELASGRRVSSVTHGTAVNDVAFAADGRSFVTAGREDGFVRRWTTSTGAPLERYNHTAPVRDLALSLDGRLLATAGGQTARIWLLDGGRLLETLRHPFAVTGVSFAPAGDALLTIARDVRVFDVATWHQQALLDRPGQIDVAKFAPAGPLVLTGARGGEATIWDWRAQELRHLLVGHTANVTDVAWSPQGDVAATASADNSGRVWRVDTGRLAQFLGAHSNQVNGIAFSPDGKTIATSSIDGSGHIWGGDSYARSAALLGHLKPAVRHPVFTPDGRGVVTTSDDGTARVWTTSVDSLARQIGRHTAAGRAVAFTRDGALIVSVGLDETVKFWRRTGTLVRSIPHPGAVVDVAVSPDGRLVLTAGADGTARLWRVADGAPVRSYPHGPALGAVAFDPSGRRVGTAGADGIARVWDAATARLLEVLRHGGVLAAVAFSPDGKRIATAGADMDGRVWRLPGGKLLGKLEGHEDDVLSIAFSPSGKQLVTASLDGDGRLWNAATFAPQRLLRHSAVVSDATFSPDGRWVATAGPTTVGLWEPSTGRRIDAGAPVRFIRGHGPRVRGVAFSPDSRRIASTGDDGTVRTYLCELCGTASQLVKLAQRRIDQLGSNLTPAERKLFLGG